VRTPPVLRYSPGWLDLARLWCADRDRATEPATSDAPNLPGVGRGTPLPAGEGDSGNPTTSSP
jgi:hypothetical protein